LPGKFLTLVLLALCLLALAFYGERGSDTHTLILEPINPDVTKTQAARARASATRS
jgi:hypothetical protein